VTWTKFAIFAKKVKKEEKMWDMHNIPYYFPDLHFGDPQCLT